MARKLIDAAALGAVLALLAREVAHGSGWLTALLWGVVGAAVGVALAVLTRRGP